MNEWEFTTDAASWINEALAANPSLPFSRAKCEQTGAASRKRRDFGSLSFRCMARVWPILAFPPHNHNSG